MIARIAATLVALVLAAAVHAETLRVNSPDDGYLNLRTGPGSQFNILMHMPHGSHVETLEYAGNWVRVRHESGTVGWAYRKYMVRYDPHPNQYKVYSPNDGFLNLRTGPGTNFGIIRPMYNGTRVRILEWAGKWVRVRTQFGHEGWAYSAYLVK